MTWNTLVHNGLYMYPDYKLQKGYVMYKKKKINISKDLEEALMIYKNTNYIKDNVFKNNFLSSIKNLLPEQCKHISQINELQIPILHKMKCNINIPEKYKYCTINGRKEYLERYVSEPAFIFIGKGNHCLRGTYKPRIIQKNISRKKFMVLICF